MAWRENEFPAAPKRPESSDQLGGMSAMAQKIQEVQEIKAVTEQVDEMVKATCANIDMLNKNISQMCEAMEIFKEDKQYFQEFINAKPLTFKVSEESLNEYTKTMSKQCMVMLDDIKTKIDSIHKEGEENIKKLEKRVKESTEKMKEVTGEGYLAIPTGTVYRFLIYFIAFTFFAGWAGKERLSQIIGENGDAMFLLIGGCAGLLYQICKNVWDWVKENIGTLKGKKKGYY